MGDHIGRLHLAAALVALVSGGWVLARVKGTPGHRRAGWLYAGAMLVLNATALAIYRLTGSFGPFHVLALVSLATLVAGILPAWRRRPREAWLERHYYFMAHSYLGLSAAAVAETATRLPAVRAFAGGPTPTFWVLVAAVSAAVIVVGSRAIRRRAGPTLRPLRPAHGAELAPPAG